ncbi:MAG: hypothetical protein AAF204_04950, partial [Pseudomonadota bacterium]
RSFLQKMRSGFNSAENFLKKTSAPQNAPQDNILSEGQQLFFDIYLTGWVKLDEVVFARVKNQQIQYSLNDLFMILELPIAIDLNAKTAQGWYIRENKVFALDFNAKTVRSAKGEFVLPETVDIDETAIWAPEDEIEKWFGFDINARVNELYVQIDSEDKLPILERLEREKRKIRKNQSPEPELPLAYTPRRPIDVPFVDVLTNSRYTRNGDTKETNTAHSANITTAGDFAYGTLTTQTRITDEDNISNIRVNYKQESPEADLLGPLKARRFEVGDVIQARLPLDNQISQELGARVTNIDPLRTFTSPTTAITGTINPGWDVELYRGQQFLDFQRVGDDGFYSFDDVILFNTDNVFRVVFYGPQGEVREEEVSIPVDLNRLSETGGIYDVSLTFDRKQTYIRNPIEDEDEGAAKLYALYEKPIAPGTAASVAFRSDEQNGERNNVLYSGISTLVGETLINANLAVDDEAEASAELVARRNIGEHDFLSRTRYSMDNYDTINSGDESSGSFNTLFNANGPIGIGIGSKPQYVANVNFNHTNAGIASTNASLGFNTRYKNFAFNDQFNYTTTNTDVEDQLSNSLVLTGAFGPNRVRLLSDYEIKPESRLRRVLATYSHNFENDLDMDLELERTIDPSLTEASAQLNWQAGWARISPSIRYNTDNDFFAGLTTNFGIARDPQESSLRSFDQAVTTNGGISVLVYLDQNGDGLFNDGEQPLENVTVNALQNGGRVDTNENGVAFFHLVRELRRTDVIVEEASLEDPYWVSGFEGASILPREGYVAELQFPIHVAGELDGTLYARTNGANPKALRNVPVHLFNADGEIEQTATTDLGGFYLFSRVPPGRYLLLVDHKVAQNNNFARPKPQQIEIGYEGTIIYGNDIFVERGQKDIPSTIISDLEDYKALHPHIDFQNAQYNIALNLGEYNSRLLMSTVWYRLHSRYRNILSGGQLMVLPEHSYADPKTGKHTLRVGLINGNLDDAYNRCHALIARDIACKVEVLPGNDQKFAMSGNTPG